MSKVILEFDKHTEREEYELALKSGDLSLAVTDFDNYLRNKLKYEDLSEADHAKYQEVRSKFWEIMKEYDINL